MTINLDLTKEGHEKVITRIVTYHQQLISSYYKRAKIRQFQLKDLVIRKSFITTEEKDSKKMNLIWEGPYKVSREGDKGSYTLTTMSDKEINKQ
ncbi:hypothetical protein ACFX2I_013233 [Malus domestica]